MFDLVVHSARIGKDTPKVRKFISGSYGGVPDMQLRGIFNSRVEQKGLRFFMFISIPTRVYAWLRAATRFSKFDGP
jgi:hypothetical protein